VVTTQANRGLLRERYEAVQDILPARHSSEACTRLTWFDGKPAGPCGRIVSWWVQFPVSGWLPRCKPCAELTVLLWSMSESRGEGGD